MVVSLVAFVALTGCIGGPETITSIFDEGTEGWTVVGDVGGIDNVELSG